MNGRALLLGIVVYLVLLMGGAVTWEALAEGGAEFGPWGQLTALAAALVAVAAALWYGVRDRVRRHRGGR